jgi:circadian clock protein KaiB
VTADLGNPLQGNGAAGDVLVMRLYIAGAAPNSLRAIENLKALCAAHFPERFSLEIVDVLREPLRALADSVLVTPTLVKLAPGAKTRVIGDLSDERKVLPALTGGMDL